MIIKYEAETKNYKNLIKFLNKKNIKFLKRRKKNLRFLIIISEIRESLIKEIEDSFIPDNILKNERADDFLNERRHINFEGNKLFSNNDFQIIAGPCSVENKQQMDKIGEILSDLDIKYIRGGAFKPRTSPYNFQGLEEKGLELLKEQSVKYDFKIITEVMDIENLKLVKNYTDIFQIGSRNMYNYSLLKEVGKLDKPVLLKRGMSANYEEFILAAEYIYEQGNKNILLCERGIRTFEQRTRFTLDLMAVPILKKLADYPVIVDPSHGTGRWDLILPAVKAALSIGAQGVMIEVHPQPELALSDGDQSLNPTNFKKLVKQINHNIKLLGKK
ncbi:MAG: bifunctional 3-deoxy-7-phosphoheptulonate synthase/chorismate mutase [Halanaerobiales bacterium]|nr:bifunctional 3-deoxy-7-phosphoheptulonate synthase/chorismate mutase [Halanaerobiales bacterium]